MAGFFSRLFGSGGGFNARVRDVNALEAEIQKLSDAGLLAASDALKGEIRAVADWEAQKQKLDQVLPRAFALVREAAHRTLKQRHFDVQLMGGMALHEGRIAEMRTGEGKTLTATLAAYLNALAGRGMHVVTVNEYLAKRDAVWMGQVYHALGLTVSCLIHEGALAYDPDFTAQRGASGAGHDHAESALLDRERDTTGSFLVQTEYLRPTSRREAYQADITYGTNHEFGFDYLRDNLAYQVADQVQGGRRHFALIDEVDSILIDEARTPLIIAAPDTESSEHYKTFARLAGRLTREEDYLVDEKMRSVDIVASGIDKVEQYTGLKNLYDPQNLRLTHYLQESLKAKELFLKDRDYVVKQGEVVLVDQFTGRLMPGRRYSGGLHQAIEAKEHLVVRQESRTYGSISIQNYFRLYAKLAGMTGTAQTSAEEFDKVYGLEVQTIPTNRPMVRTDASDFIYKTATAKTAAIVADLKARQERGQPVLVGTVSIEKNEMLSRELARAGVRHEVLNAKANEREGAIIAQAGRKGAVTVATNLAGRGVDIILGGNPADPKEAEEVRALGGLHVVGTERHESRRIDNQLRGRSGRQGDPGSTQFYLSLEDDLMRIFGGDRIRRLMETLKVPEDTPIQAGMVNRAINQAQAKVEGMNFDSRKHLLEYDDVMNKQRLSIYRKRQDLLESRTAGPILAALDMFWMTHLENMEALQEAVRLRAYGQHDPLVEYRREGHTMFQAMLQEFENWRKENEARFVNQTQEPAAQGISIAAMPQQSPIKVPDATSRDQKAGRNDPCPCGSGKKYKKCHGQ
jgi:preprotein translocase subunit SecA